jgi:hypothetical protein
MGGSGDWRFDRRTVHGQSTFLYRATQAQLHAHNRRQDEIAVRYSNSQFDRVDVVVANHRLGACFVRSCVVTVSLFSTQECDLSLASPFCFSSHRFVLISCEQHQQQQKTSWPQQQQRTLPGLEALYAIHYYNGATTVDGLASPTEIETAFVHLDVTNVEANGPVSYGSIQVKYYNVVDQGCYDAAGDNGATCTCSPTNEVHSPAGGGAAVTASFTTTDSGTSNDNTVTTTVVANAATLLDSDAVTVTGSGTTVYVAYCLRLTLYTDDTPTPLAANALDVLVYFTGPNDVNHDFIVTTQSSGGFGGSGNPVPDMFTVTARLCSGTIGVGPPLTEGAAVNICVESNDDPAARIVSITSWTWSYAAGSTVVQNAVTAGAASNALTTAGSCTAADLNTSPITKSKCEFTTTFGTAIYDAIGVGNMGTVVGVGTVNLAFHGETARPADIALRSSVTLDLIVAGPKVEEDVDDDDDKRACNCFFLNIFCWILRCLLAIIFS